MSPLSLANEERGHDQTNEARLRSLDSGRIGRGSISPGLGRASPLRLARFTLGSSRPRTASGMHRSA